MRFGDQNKHSLSVLLRSLAYQVAQSLPSFRKGIVQLIAEATKFDTADAQTIWSRVFRSILFKIRLEVPLYWVIDGLEESDDPRALIKLLSDINLVVLPIRILIVSRRTQGLASSFQRLSKEVQVDMVPYEGNTTDIHSSVDQELDVSGDDKFKSYVRHQILQRAAGNFLWVHSAVQRINDCHTSANVERALEQLPSGMEALYNRMATSVAMLPQQEDKQLAGSILGWVTCALRLLTIEELSLLLEKDVSRPLDLQRSIGDLCGGFVIVDNGGNIAMVHQTAREYLIEGRDRPFSIDPVSAHARLFARCMHCLMDFGLRSKIARKQIPVFLDYAATSCFYHLSHSHIESQDMIATLSSFFNGPSVLTWIQSLAQSNRLRTPILASTQLTCFVKRQYESVSTARPLHSRTLLEAWATDLVRIVDKFGTNLLKNPESIYKLIPPFCPHDSVMYQQHGSKESNMLRIAGYSPPGWDDSFARLSFSAGIHATSIRAAGGLVAVLSPSGTVILYYASTCEEIRRLEHRERVLRMRFNLSGTLLVTYGYRTTKVWELPSGRCINSIQNPVERPRPHTIIITDDDILLVGSDDRKIRSSRPRDPAACWQTIADIDEQALEGTIVNSPTCMALSPDGTLVAVGYRGHPLSAWEVHGPDFIGHCLRVLDDSTQSHAEHAWGEVVQLT